jgi:hypothetical protein
MSADNWTECPNCRKKAEAEKLERIEAVAKGYGKVKREKYDQLVAKAAESIKLEQTLREDYELGVLRGKDFSCKRPHECVFYIIYSCSCSHCSFEFKHRYEQEVKLPED